MTFFQAVEAVERKALNLRFKYPDKEPVEAIVVLAWVGQYHGKRYDFTLDSMSNGYITPGEYCLEMIKMIIEFSQRPRKYEN